MFGSQLVLEPCKQGSALAAVTQVETALAFSSLMSQDPWEVEANPLDLNDGMDDRSQVPIAYTQAAADWLPEAGQALFAQGPEVSVSEAKQMHLQP